MAKSKIFRGFSVKHRVFRLFQFRRRSYHSTAGYLRLDPDAGCWRAKAASGLVKLSSFLKTKAKEICSSRNLVPGRGYMKVGHYPDSDPFGEKPVPKGKVAVYVGQKDGGAFQRVLVPVIYCNHPLFGQLLREAENEFGYNHPGAITIPCRISEFEHVQTRIKQGRAAPRGLLTWRRTDQLEA